MGNYTVKYIKVGVEMDLERQAISKLNNVALVISNSCVNKPLDSKCSFQLCVNKSAFVHGKCIYDLITEEENQCEGPLTGQVMHCALYILQGNDLLDKM